jgi:hypothetical protein
MTHGAPSEPDSGTDRRDTRPEGTGWPADMREPRPDNGADGPGRAVREVPPGWPEPPRIHPRRVAPGQESRATGGRWRSHLLAATLIVLVAASLVGAVLRSGILAQRANRSAPRPAAVTPPPVPTPTPTPSVTPTVVQQGAGNFAAAETEGPVLGTAGVLRRFHVEVENGINEDPAAFAKAIDDTLGDPRSWIAAGQFRLQRVPTAVAAEFTIYLASPVKSEAMCAVAGLQTDKYTSCRITGQVIINDARWLTAIPDYNAPLSVYRAYAINHEVGHQLGHGHEACTGPGQAAPVMQQQTLGLQGCVANSWPFINGQRYAGPPVP